MIYKTLGNSPAEALNGTSVLHTAGLLQGAMLLRVHDPSAAKEAIQLTRLLQ
jgi:dihydropteroate synthase